MKTKKSARRKDCANNLKQIGRGLMLYEDRYGKFPEETGNAFLRRLTAPNVALIGEDILLCPVRGGGTIYDNYMGPNEVLTENIEPDRPIAADNVGNHGQPPEPAINILFFDCSAQVSPDDATIFNGRVNFRNYLSL